MDKVVANVDRFGLDNPLQAAYKALHSTETALLSVTNDILSSIEQVKPNYSPPYLPKFTPV